MGLSCYLPMVGLVNTNSNDHGSSDQTVAIPRYDLQRCSLVPRSYSGVSTIRGLFFVES